MSRYFDRQGNEIELTEWMKLIKDDDRDYKRIALTTINAHIEVSTVWLGLNHNWTLSGPPLIFETMIFEDGIGDYCVRYSTEKEALNGHEEIVKHLKEVVTDGSTTSVQEETD